MLDPKKLRFRLIIVAILVIFFIIGFLKNHVFAVCNTNTVTQWNAHQWTPILCGGEEQGNFVGGQFGPTINEDRPFQVLTNFNLCAPVSAGGNYNLYFGETIHYDGFLTHMHGLCNAETAPHMTSYVCFSNMQRWCLFSTGEGHLWDANGIGAGFAFGFYTQCNEFDPPIVPCQYRTCPEGKHLGVTCTCECNNFCNLPVNGGCQSQNEETCACECPEASNPDGRECVATNSATHIFNNATCSTCDAQNQFGTVHLHESGVYWMPFPNPPGVTLDMMFYGTDKNVSSGFWQCLAPSGKATIQNLSDSLVTYSEIYPTLQANCSFAYYTVPDYGGAFYKTYSTYVYFSSSKAGTGACAGMNLEISTQGFIGELGSSEKTESHGTMFHSEGHKVFKNRGRFGGGYEIQMP